MDDENSRRKVQDLRARSPDAIRGLIKSIHLEPDGGRLKITLVGELAGMLSAARDTKRSPDTGDLLVQIQWVAGARSPLDLELPLTVAELLAVS
ncbi:hypothetical protein LuPra_04073 [Luteitalea pratensis]|uniref:Uncharacterized protein n=1 Tax=Luteitalea pratensis TaxID=1855912 RepID=A0A143PRV4_LUTPR|nr:hypothetical protein [Luteitalea pratensis]AMY10830.1 hypothetical protein LuPra_04073 [Luteitalea pratensis]